MREAILLTVAHPAVAAVIFVLGWLGVVTEFLRPGKVLPGALGGVLALLALWSLIPGHAELAAVVAAPLVAIALGLFSLAWRVRKQKTGGAHLSPVSTIPRSTFPAGIVTIFRVFSENANTGV